MGKALQGYEPAMEDVARRLMRDLPTGQPISFHSYMRTLAREVIMSVVFGVTEPERRARLAAHLTELDRLIGSRGLALRYAASMASRGRWLPFPARSGLGRVGPGDLRRDRRPPLVVGRHGAARLPGHLPENSGDRRPGPDGRRDDRRLPAFVAGRRQRHDRSDPVLGGGAAGPTPGGAATARGDAGCR